MARISSTPAPGRVVDVEVRVAQRLQRVRDVAVFLLADLPAHQPVVVDLRLGREHAHEQLLFRHFQAEEAGDLVVGRHVLRDVEDEARLAHRRPGRDDDQVAALEAARHLVDLGKAGRDAGDEALVLEELLDLREAVFDQIPHRDETRLDAVVGDRKDGALGFVQNQVGVLIGLIGVRENLVRRVDQVRSVDFSLTIRA